MASEVVYKRKADNSLEQRKAKHVKGTGHSCMDNGNASRDVSSSSSHRDGRTSSANNDTRRNSQDRRSEKHVANALPDLVTLAWGNLSSKKPPSQGLCITGLPEATGTKRSESLGHAMVTRGIAKSMTQNALFNTGELLEKIITCLPAQTLIRVRRVNRIWNHTILTLPETRRTLFLDTEPLSRDFWVYDRRNDILQPYMSPMLEVYGTAWRDRQSYCRPTVLNPLLFAREKDFKTHREKVPDLHDRARTCESLRFVARPDLSKPLGSALHHEMFVTQPPVSSVEFVFYYHDRALRRQQIYSPLQAKRLRIHQTGGVRFRHVLEAFVAAAQGGLRPAGYGLPDFTVRVKGTEKTKKLATVWMLGAIFVSEQEERQVEEMRKAWLVHGEDDTQPEEAAVQLSPQAKQHVAANNGRLIDFRPTSDDFVDKAFQVRGEERKGHGRFARGLHFASN
ncbi:hypothetical protein CERZMDRAFT_99613 [Cercospora zeae-maydis SCOH1-5]|uniref:F-box domain-containing protein n=1 Tax=Cercospora zeae-maydis SCOH1-5 TaxID=717836 RepID=A0A6A6FA39_9PEZI|nr:hypothetical protein CERZMDRAFT_99613 [Cercospora zeae-maydis SCOH1-5]